MGQEYVEMQWGWTMWRIEEEASAWTRCVDDRQYVVEGLPRMDEEGEAVPRQLSLEKEQTSLDGHGLQMEQKRQDWNVSGEKWRCFLTEGHWALHWPCAFRFECMLASTEEREYEPYISCGCKELRHT